MAPQPARALTCGDAVVGVIDETGGDHYWIHGRFSPGPSYQQYAPLFDRERELREAYEGVAEDAPDDVHEAAHGAWMAALGAVNDLGLSFRGARVRDFKIDCRGECEFKLGL